MPNGWKILAAMSLLLAARVPAQPAGDAPPSPAPPPGPGAAAPTSPADDVIEVEVEGEGMSRESALKAALRAALERGGQVEIFSHSEVANFQLMHDTIIARASGIITDYRVLQEQPGVGGTRVIRIRARVSKRKLAQSWVEVQNILRQVGKPRIMVWINEQIGGKPERQSILETVIEEQLLKSGFDLVDKSAIKEIRQRELIDATSEGHLNRLRAVAKDFDAHIFIAGTANADPAGLESVYEVPIAFYNCDVQVKAYYTDTGRLLASKGIANTRGGARGRREHSPQAGKTALANAGEQVVRELYGQVLEQWTTAITAGGEIRLEVEGMNYGAARRLRDALGDMDGIESVNMDLTKGIATYRITARMGTEEFADRLSGGDLAGEIEIIDLKPNRLQARPAAP